MRFAYADPPYPGQAYRLYGEHSDYGGEVDHRELIERLERDYSDGWALSTSAAALPDVLPLCPVPEMSRKNKGRRLDNTGVRVLVWVKTPVVPRPVAIQWGWEPIIVRRTLPRDERFVRDWIRCPPHTGKQFVGAKPEAVCRYIFDALGARPDDALDDLFPGSGAVGAAWDAWSRQLELGAA